MKIGILRTGVTLPIIQQKHGDFDVLFKNLLADDDFDFTSYKVLEDEFPDSINTCDAWLITGSAHSAYEKLPWIARLEQFLRDAYSADIPIVGICFGHQILAQALGGKVEKFEKGWGVGPHQYHFDGIKNPVVINAWHQDQVTALPEDSEVVGRSEFCENAAIIYGKKAFTIQAHPEFTNSFTEDLIEQRRKMVPADLIEVAEAELTKSNPSKEVVEQIKTFFKQRSIDLSKAQ